MPTPRSPEERLVDLEVAVMHVQRDLDNLNAALVGQQKEIEAIRRMVARLDERLSQLDDEEEPRDPAAEKPPHY